MLGDERRELAVFTALLSKALATLAASRLRVARRLYASSLAGVIAAAARSGVGLQVDLERRLMIVLTAGVAESSDPTRDPVGEWRSANHERVITTLCDRVHPTAVAGGVGAVGGESAAG
jgi:hypothetical protein